MDKNDKIKKIFKLGLLTFEAARDFAKHNGDIDLQEKLEKKGERIIKEMKATLDSNEFETPDAAAEYVRVCVRRFISGTPLESKTDQTVELFDENIADYLDTKPKKACVAFDDDQNGMHVVKNTKERFDSAVKLALVNNPNIKKNKIVVAMLLADDGAKKFPDANEDREAVNKLMVVLVKSVAKEMDMDPEEFRGVLIVKLAPKYANREFLRNAMIAKAIKEAEEKYADAAKEGDVFFSLVEPVLDPEIEKDALEHIPEDDEPYFQYKDIDNLTRASKSSNESTSTSSDSSFYKQNKTDIDKQLSNFFGDNDDKDSDNDEDSSVIDISDDDKKDDVDAIEGKPTINKIKSSVELTKDWKKSISELENGDLSDPKTKELIKDLTSDIMESIESGKLSSPNAYAVPTKEKREEEFSALTGMLKQTNSDGIIAILDAIQYEEGYTTICEMVRSKEGKRLLKKTTDKDDGKKDFVIPVVEYKEIRETHMRTVRATSREEALKLVMGEYRGKDSLSRKIEGADSEDPNVHAVNCKLLSFKTIVGCLDGGQDEDIEPLRFSEDLAPVSFMPDDNSKTSCEGKILDIKKVAMAKATKALLAVAAKDTAKKDKDD